MIALLNVLCFDIDQVYIGMLFASILLREVKVKRRDQLIHGTVRAVIVVVIKRCSARAAVAAHERLVRHERVVLAQFRARLFRVLRLAMLKLDIIVGGAAPPPGIGTLAHCLAVEDGLRLVHVDLGYAAPTSPAV